MCVNRIRLGYSLSKSSGEPGEQQESNHWMSDVRNIDSRFGKTHQKKSQNLAVQLNHAIEFE